MRIHSKLRRIGKRGIVVSRFLKNILITIMTLLILLFTIQEIADSTIEKTKSDICKKSVQANELLHIRGVELVGDEVNCPTDYHTISGDDERQIQLEVARDMAKCWDDFGKGELTLFSKKQLYCSVCHVIDFKEEGISIDGFTTFLADTYMDGKNISYMDFLMAYETPKAREYIDDDSIYDKTDTRLSNQLDTSKDYSVIFIYAKGEEALGQLKRYLGGRGKTSMVLALGTAGIAGFGTAKALGITAAIIGVTPPGWIATGAVAGSVALISGGLVVAKTFFGGEDKYQLSFIMLKEHTAEEFAEIGCDYYPSVQHEFSKELNNEE